MSRVSRYSPHKDLHRIGERFAWCCHWCGEPVRCATCEPANTSNVRRATRDHVIPWSEGGRRRGPDGSLNLVLACFSCNQARKPDGPSKRLRLAADPVAESSGGAP